MGHRTTVPDREGKRRLPRDWRHRARHRHALLHDRVLRTRWHVPREAPQADADGDGTAHLGLRRRIHAARLRYADWQAWRRDLLGELHAAAAHGDVCEG